MPNDEKLNFLKGNKQSQEIEKAPDVRILDHCFCFDVAFIFKNSNMSAQPMSHLKKALGPTARVHWYPLLRYVNTCFNNIVHRQNGTIDRCSCAISSITKKQNTF
jgi:hypothetical protein